MRRAYDKTWRLLRFHLIAKQATRLLLLSTLTVGFIAMMVATSIIGFAFSNHHEAQLSEYRLVTRNIRILQQALIDAETGVRGFLLADRVEYLEPYFSGLTVVTECGPGLLPQIDDYSAQSSGSGEPHAVSRRISELRRIWTDVVELTENHAAVAAEQMLVERQEKRVMDELRSFLGTYTEFRSQEALKADAVLARQRNLLLGIDLSGALIAIIAVSYAFRRSVLEIRRREAAIAGSEQTSQRVQRLFAMTSMLQSAPDREDANEVLRATAVHLLPGFSGLLYVFNNSQDRLILSTAWGPGAADPVTDHIAPPTCWAMKRGKPHLNIPAEDALRCQHHLDDGTASLEIPMAACGQVYGLLVIGTANQGAVAALQEIQPIAMALADAMSLALSGMALRDQLRNQAIRDPLTGLYNRRFLDETLDRLGLDARRRKAPLAAIMIDLDHFKRLNDQHGHATGDAVLRGVAAAITAGLRATDIACRYGGEELAVLLPDCPLDMAVAKAEQLRVSIAEIRPGPSGVTVTASLGVATIPDTSATSAGLLASADAALYQAKQKGRNCVVQAKPQPPSPDGPREAPGPVLAWPPRLPAQQHPTHGIAGQNCHAETERGS